MAPRSGGSERQLLRLMRFFGMPAEQVDAMVAAGPAPRHYNPDTRPLLKLLREMAKRPAVSDLVLEKPDFRLELRRNGGAGAHA